MYWAMKFEENPESVARIEIAEDFTVTDGRHRIAGAEMMNETKIRAVIFPVKSKAEQVERAFLANIDPNAPKPPTKEDIIVSVREMLGQGMSKAKILELVSKYAPEPHAKKFIDEARHGIYRDKMNNAKHDVFDHDLTITEAANKHGVDEAKLRSEISGKKTGGKKNAAHFKKVLSTQFRSQGQKIANTVKAATKAYDDTDMSSDQLMEVYDYLGNYLKRQLKNVKDQAERFEKRNKNSSKHLSN
jgi:hypothetical protein